MYSSGYYLIDPEFNIIGMNDTAKSIYPQLRKGEKCYKCLMDLDSPCGLCPVVNGIKGPRTYVDPIRKITEQVDAVEVIHDGYDGVCHALVFCTVGNEAEFAATLPKTSEELKNLALIKGLAVDYYDVFSVRISDGMTSMYRFDGKSVDNHSIFKEQMLYEERMRQYIDTYVHEDDRAFMSAQTSIDYIAQKLKTNEMFMLHYRVLYNDKVHYFFRKIVRVGEVDTFDNFLVGVACEDTEVLEIQKRKELEKNLSIVQYDSLTGLLNKEAFLMQGDKLIKLYPDYRYDFCILKLENLGLINHQYGSLAGDKILQIIGALLKSYEEEENCIGYMGNGVFASLTMNTDENMRKGNIFEFKWNIMQQSEIKNLALKWSIYKEIPEDCPITELYEKTAYALSTIRASMHDDYVEFNQSMIERMERNAAIENEFEHALEAGELVSWYQPKYSVKTQKIVGAEALVRWIKPDGTIVSPGEFIPILENCGKISMLDHYIFELTCQMQKKLHDGGLPEIPISVNLSRASMFMENLAEKYDEIVEYYGISADKVPIEITESAAVRAASIKHFASQLIDRGFVLHMDDFGSGYSSLASLQVIPFESIKIDKSLIDFIGKDDGENLLKHVIEFARESGKTVVAEGVETFEQYLFLKVVGCDAIQGYYYSKPVDEATFIQMLSEQV